MVTSIDCIPCLLRQTIEALRFSFTDKKIQEKILKEIILLTAELDLTLPPPLIAGEIHRRMRNISKIDDPYKDIKKKFTHLALSMIEQCRLNINSSKDPFLSALKLSIAGNIIDSGAKSGLNEKEVIEQIDTALNEVLHGDIDTLASAVKKADKILYIADNAGEIVFDLPLIELIGSEKITFVVRGGPVINDATIEDAINSGITTAVKVISSGSDIPGTIPDICSSEFQKHYHDADLIISKGQGNYETLSEEKKNIFFLLKVKCAVIAEHTGFPIGSHVLINAMEKKTRPDKKTIQNKLTIHPIGIIHSEHKNKSETPIQPIFARGCKGHAEIFPEYIEGLKDLDGFSHIFILFHLHKSGTVKLHVKPFLDNKERGLFSTRAPSRPNPIGMSIVEITGIKDNLIYLDNLDILDGTPIIDIKPYIGKFDKIESTRSGWLDLISEKDAALRGKRNYKKN